MQKASFRAYLRLFGVSFAVLGLWLVVLVVDVEGRRFRRRRRRTGVRLDQLRVDLVPQVPLEATHVHSLCLARVAARTISHVDFVFQKRKRANISSLYFQNRRIGATLG